MENKVNVAEILKNCPEGAKLYSPVFGECKFVEVFGHIVVTDKDNNKRHFYQDGRYHDLGDCVLFPSKDQQDWSKFHIPYKCGDIVACDTERGVQLFIFKEYVYNHDYVQYYMSYFDGEIDFEIGDSYVERFATEEEKKKLFKVIEEHGLRWNNDTKTLEKLVEPKFKVGDRVVRKNGIGVPVLITRIVKNYYYSDNGDLVEFFKIVDQDDYELVPNKFDISTLVPFESRVLVRDFEDQIWRPAIFGGYIDSREQYKYTVVGGLSYECLIPYEGNEHLRCKDDDCIEYYKTWEE